MGIFVYAFTATGKSTLAKKYKNVIDMESTLYKYICDCEDEKSKGSDDRVLNPNWPQNYFEALEKVKDSYDYILISDNICDSWLRQNKIVYYQVYPNENLLHEYVERVRSRGNSEVFVNYLIINWKDWIDGCKNDKFASKIIELKQGQYLQDVLANLVER